MKRILPVLVVATLSAWTAAAQNSPAVQTDASARAQAQTSANAGRDGMQASGSGSASTSAATGGAVNGDKAFAGVHDGTKINAALKSSLDAKKSKPGDPVEARTTEDVKENGKVVLKKGTRLEGHVTQAQARANGESQSRLGIVFDHAVLHDGQEVPFNATIQALAATQSAASAEAGGGDDLIASGGGRSAVAGTTRGGGGLVGSVTSTAGATAGGLVNTASAVPVNAGGTLSSATRTTGTVGGLTAAGRLTSESSGVFGLEGLSLDSAASNAITGSMVVSGSRNVHLASGTQMLLTASGQAH